MMNFSGYVGILIAYVTTFAVTVVLYGDDQHRLNRRYVPVIAYVNGCIAVFLHVPMIVSLLERGTVTLPHHLQISLLIISLNMLIQVTILRFFSGIFYLVFALGILHILASVGLLFFSGIGIIKFVWFFIFGGALCGYVLLIWFFSELHLVFDGHATGEVRRQKEIAEFVREESSKFMRLTIQGWLALAASIGISMSILFGEGQKSWDNPAFLQNAVSMVIAFGLVTIGVGVWLVKPYLDNYQKLNRLQQKLSEAEKAVPDKPSPDALNPAPRPRQNPAHPALRKELAPLGVLLLLVYWIIKR